MVDNVETGFPATFDELVEQVPVLKGLPKMAAPGELTPSQSADFLVLETVLEETLEKVDDEKESVAKAMRMGYLIEVADEFFSKIAANREQYAKWAKGRPAGDLVGAYLNLAAFYRIELGKLAVSTTPSENAGQN